MQGKEKPPVHEGQGAAAGEEGEGTPAAKTTQPWCRT